MCLGARCAGPGREWGEGGRRRTIGCVWRRCGAAGEGAGNAEIAIGVGVGDDGVDDGLGRAGGSGGEIDAGMLGGREGGGGEGASCGGCGRGCGKCGRGGEDGGPRRGGCLHDERGLAEGRRHRLGAGARGGQRSARRAGHVDWDSGRVRQRRHEPIVPKWRLARVLEPDGLPASVHPSAVVLDVHDALQRRSCKCPVLVVRHRPLNAAAHQKPIHSTHLGHHVI